MVGYLTTSHNLLFSQDNDVSLSHPHKNPLHIKFLIHKHKAKYLLIDGGVDLNICTLKIIRALGFLENAIDPKKKITIKAYDDEERSLEGLVVFPISVGPIQKDTFFQVLGMELTYNLLLGQPWIHEM